MAGIPGADAQHGAPRRSRTEAGLALRLTLFGTGALASLFGARLARAGEDVTLVGTWREALAAIARDGILVEDQDGSWVVCPRVARLDQALDPAPLAIVLVKSRQTAAVAPVACRCVRDDGLILTLQNGLGNRERLSETAGSERVVLGLAFLGATLVGPGHVRAGGGLRLVLEEHARIAQAAGSLRAAGFAVDLVRDIEPVLWRKLVANCAINPLAALHGVPNGELLDGGERQATLEGVAREVASVARALGIDVGDDPAASATSMARETAVNRSSMLQDLERGAPTEIEALNAAVVRRAEALGVAVPLNRRLVSAVRERERRRGATFSA